MSELPQKGKDERRALLDYLLSHGLTVCTDIREYVFTVGMIYSLIKGYELLLFLVHK